VPFTWPLEIRPLKIPLIETEPPEIPVPLRTARASVRNSHAVQCLGRFLNRRVAPAAFDLLKENVDTCTPSRPITVISFRSTGDTFVDYNGAYSTYVSSMPITFLGAKATFQKWAEIDQCIGTPSAEDANNCSTYSSCGGGVQVTLCSKQGGTHEQGTASIGWPLLKKYTLP